MPLHTSLWAQSQSHTWSEGTRYTNHVLGRSWTQGQILDKERRLDSWAVSLAVIFGLWSFVFSILWIQEPERYVWREGMIAINPPCWLGCEGCFAVWDRTQTAHYTLTFTICIKIGKLGTRGRPVSLQNTASLLLEVTHLVDFHHLRVKIKGAATGNPGLGQTPKLWENNDGSLKISKI